MEVVIAGAGIYGCSTAYFLKKQAEEKGISLTLSLVDPSPSSPGAHASGKAGGFLGRRWVEGEAMQPLMEKSFLIHEELAEDLGREEVDYRRLKAYLVSSVPSSSVKDSTPPLLDGGKVDRLMNGLDGGAQVKGWVDIKGEGGLFRLSGARLVKGAVVGVKEGRVEVEDEGHRFDIRCSHFVLATGPWVGRDLKKLFPFSPLSAPDNVEELYVSEKCTSVVWTLPGSLKSLTKREQIGALFTDSRYDVELYPRPGGEVYACGWPERKPLPSPLSTLEPEAFKAEDVKKDAEKFCSVLSESTISKSTSCFLPGSPDGQPVVGALPLVVEEGGEGGRGGCSSPSCFIACGGTCWGITTGPAVGFALARMILGGEVDPEIEKLLPSRFLKE